MHTLKGNRSTSSFRSYITDLIPTKQAIIKGIGMGLGSVGLHALPVCKVISETGVLLSSAKTYVTPLNFCLTLGCAGAAYLGYKRLKAEVYPSSKAVQIVKHNSTTRINSNLEAVKTIPGAEVVSMVAHDPRGRAVFSPSSDIALFGKTLLETAGLTCLQIARTEFVHNITQYLPAGQEIIPKVLVDAVHKVFTSKITMLKSLFGTQTRLELFSNFGKPAYFYNNFVCASIEEVAFRGLFQKVLLTSLPKYVFPKHKELIDSTVAKIFRMGVTSLCFSIAHSSYMQEPGEFVAHFLSDLLSSYYRETGMSLAQLSVIHGTHNSLYRAYEFGLPRTIKELNADLRTCELLNSQFNLAGNTLKACQGKYGNAWTIVCAKTIERFKSVVLDSAMLGCPGVKKW